MEYKRKNKMPVFALAVWWFLANVSGVWCATTIESSGDATTLGWRAAIVAIAARRNHHTDTADTTDIDTAITLPESTDDATPLTVNHSTASPPRLCHWYSQEWGESPQNCATVPPRPIQWLVVYEGDDMLLSTGGRDLRQITWYYKRELTNAVAYQVYWWSREYDVRDKKNFVSRPELYNTSGTGCKGNLSIWHNLTVRDHGNEIIIRNVSANHAGYYYYVECAYPGSMYGCGYVSYSWEHPRTDYAVVVVAKRADGKSGAICAISPAIANGEVGDDGDDASGSGSGSGESAYDDEDGGDDHEYDQCWEREDEEKKLVAACRIQFYGPQTREVTDLYSALATSGRDLADPVVALPLRDIEYWNMDTYYSKFFRVAYNWKVAVLGSTCARAARARPSLPTALPIFETKTETKRRLVRDPSFAPVTEPLKAHEYSLKLYARDCSAKWLLREHNCALRISLHLLFGRRLYSPRYVETCEPIDKNWYHPDMFGNLTTWTTQRAVATQRVVGFDNAQWRWAVGPAPATVATAATAATATTEDANHLDKIWQVALVCAPSLIVLLLCFKVRQCCKKRGVDKKNKGEAERTPIYKPSKKCMKSEGPLSPIWIQCEESQERRRQQRRLNPFTEPDRSVMLQIQNRVIAAAAKKRGDYKSLNA